MKKMLSRISCSAVALTAVALLPSCSMEEPFKADGEGSLTILTEINGNVVKTRAAIGEEEMAKLRENCIVYIENSKGVIRKFKGVDNIPAEIRLQTGSYVAEAWSGDSVSASFSSKFYRGYERFEIEGGQQTLTLNCNIANVVVSVDPSSLDIDLNDMKVTFSHSRGFLEFDEQAIRDNAKGYFMMPNADKDLSYVIEGTKLDGTAYSREGVIEGVERAHEYCLTLSQNDNQATEGGAIIQVEIADIPLIEETVEILPGPAVKGLGFDIENQVSNVEAAFKDIYVYVKGYEELSSILLSFDDKFDDPVYGKEINIFNNKPELEAKGITFTKRSSTEVAGGADVALDEVIITFSKEFLNSLEVSEKEYDILIEGVDKKHRIGQAHLRIVNSQGAVEVVHPVTSVDIPSDDLTLIKAHSVTVPGIVNDAENAQNYGIKYRKQGSYDWLEAYPDGRNAMRSTRASYLEYRVTLTGLEQNSVYEYKSFCDGFEDAEIKTFQTEAVYQIPNSSMEEWGTYGNNITVPGLTGNKLTCFWGSGNEGSAMAGKTLTTKNTDPNFIHSGNASAKLASDKALGVLAAGNIFIGNFDSTNHIKYGVIKVGREYNGSHPSKVSVYLNYRPGSVDCTASGAPLKSGESDHGQVYIGLITEPLALNTYDTSTLFNRETIATTYKDKVVAYGEVTFTSGYGNDNEMKKLEVDFEYTDLVKTVKPQYLVIVCCASKYGDYYAGSSKSVMYVDDFELIYE